MISTQVETDPYLIEITTSDLSSGKLSHACYIIKHRIGKLKPEKLKAVIYTLFTVLTKDDEP
jgi:hypothetical protein